MWSISGSAIDNRYVDALTPYDLAKPVLAVNHDTFGYMRMIDGHHRITRLNRDAEETFPLYLVPEEEVSKFVQVVRWPKPTDPAAYVELIKSEG